MKGTLFGDLPEEKGNKQAVAKQTKNEEVAGVPPMFGAMSHLKPAMAPVSVKRATIPKRNKAPVRRQAVEKGNGMDLLSTPIQQNTVLETTVQDAYDPSKPNDYEHILKNKERMRQEKEIELDRLKRKRMEKEKPKEEVPVMVEQKKPEKGMTLAQKMLEKMGWKKGEGLGKMKQGISAALEVEKTDARSGRVIMPAVAPTKTHAPYIPTNPPSRVIILTNMVGPGQVDATLDEEIGEECSKYGEVESVLIFEVTDPTYPPDKAVRIFVQFDTQESAAAALQELHGRYFAGRVVSVDYFDSDRFDSQDVAPKIN